VNVGINTQFNEVTWYYPSLSSDYVNRFVTYNYMENVWSVGSMARTAWTDIGTFEKPLATEYDPLDTEATITTIYGLTPGRSHLYNQEDGVDANGEAIDAYMYSGYFDIGDGDQMLLMQKFIPDFKRQEGDMTVRCFACALTHKPLHAKLLGPLCDHSYHAVCQHAGARPQIQLRIESDELGSWWRFGTMRVDIQPDGFR
jgi:hypothetical protein